MSARLGNEANFQMTQPSGSRNANVEGTKADNGKTSALAGQESSKTPRTNLRRKRVQLIRSRPLTAEVVDIR